ncbi:MAG: nitrilase family protein [Bacteroidota bacterium]
MPASIRAATVQFQHRPGDKSYNLSRISHFCSEAAKAHVRLIAFPEMCVSGYWHVRNLDQAGVAALAEPAPGGDTCVQLLDWARQYDMVIGAGIVEEDDDGAFYNTYVVAMPDGRLEKHRKLHCFINSHISSGNEYTVFDTPLGVRVGVLICYDNNIIENARITALRGADILMAPHQTGGTASRSPHAMGVVEPALWENRKRDPEAIEAAFRGDKGRGWLMRWLPSRAHDNGMFILFSNGVGLDDDEVRTGNAMVLDCYGRTVAETWKAADAMVVADLDLTLLPLCSGRRWMRGRRPALYDEITQAKGSEFGAREARFSEEATSRS